jgi:hypothetical protein
MKKEQSINDIFRIDLLKFQFNHYNYLEIMKEREILEEDQESLLNSYGFYLYLFEKDILNWYVNNEIHCLIIDVFKSYNEEVKILDLKKEDSLETFLKIIDNLLDNLYNIYINSADKKKSIEYTKDNILELLYPNNTFLLDDDSKFEELINNIKRVIRESDESTERSLRLTKEWEDEEEKEREEAFKIKENRIDYSDDFDYPYCSSCESSPCMCSDPERTSSLW